MNEIPREINGVSLFTKAGTLRKKYSVADRLAIAGATERHLETFIEWLCPYAKQYAITKAGSDDPQAWLTVKRQPSRKDILRHLLGDAIPGVKPLWVAPWAGEYTRWIGLDIDLHGDDKVDFEQRVAIATGAMTTLGYREDDLLWSPTPSGGLHVRGFLIKTQFTYQLQHLFECLGIVHTPGQLEIYPREGYGLRLPFGKIPGKPFDPSAWVRFAKALDRSEGIYRMEWSEMWERAQEQMWTHPEGLMRPDPAPAPAAPVPLDPVASGAQAEPCTTEGGQHLPIAQKITCTADAEAMYERGIHREGMRVAATNQLAWHFIHAEGKSIEETIDLLTRWSYDTGRTTSKDVQRDLANGTTKVAEQVAEIVRSIAKLPRTVGARPADGVYKEELLWIAHGLNTQPKSRNAYEREVAFACNILIFAKGYGEEAEWSWEAPISAGGVMRKWRRFTGMRYLAPLQGLQKAGLLTLVKEKIQTSNKTGRPCTWGLRVPPRMDANAKAKGEVPMDIDEAVDYAMRIWQRAADEEAERQRLDGLRSFTQRPRDDTDTSGDDIRANGSGGA